jgi:hypothetical protein
MLRTSTRWYKPRGTVFTPDEIAYAAGNVFEDEREALLRVMLPVREVAFDTLTPANDFNIHALGRADPRRFMKDTDFQITYSFSTAMRVNTRGIAGSGSYGSANISFRRLYDFLCTKFNRGERFVDTYFQYKFPTSPVGRRFAEFEDTVRGSMREQFHRLYVEALEGSHTKAGALTKPAKRRILKYFDFWKSGAPRFYLQEFDRSIRQEIISMLRTGQIPLQHENRSETMDLRRELGLPAVPEFYVTGQLIRAVQIDIRIPEAAFA